MTKSLIFEFHKSQIEYSSIFTASDKQFKKEMCIFFCKKVP